MDVSAGEPACPILGRSGQAESRAILRLRNRTKNRIAETDPERQGGLVPETIGINRTISDLARHDIGLIILAAEALRPLTLRHRRSYSDVSRSGGLAGPCPTAIPTRRRAMRRIACNRKRIWQYEIMVGLFANMCFTPSGWER